MCFLKISPKITAREYGHLKTKYDKMNNIKRKERMSIMIKQTAGRDQLGDFAPEFAHYNDDILFGENWNDDAIDLKTRCMITVVALMSSGITDSSLKYHLENAKKNGVTKEEMAGIITHTSCYERRRSDFSMYSRGRMVSRGRKRGCGIETRKGNYNTSKC